MRKTLVALMVAGMLAGSGVLADRPDWAQGNNAGGNAPGENNAGGKGRGGDAAAPPADPGGFPAPAIDPANPGVPAVRPGMGDAPGGPGVPPAIGRDGNRTESRRFRQEFRNRLRREITGARRHEMRHGMHARLRRGEDIEIGRSVMDVHGNRVRVEKFLSRPAPNQVRVHVLNTRPDLGNRVDQSVWTGTFNRPLPPDLRGIHRDMWGRVGIAPPPFHLTDVHRLETSGGNSLVVTHNGGWVYPAAWGDLAVPGGPVVPPGQAANIRPFLVVFNEERVSVNGIDKIWRHRVNHDPVNRVFGDVQIFHPKADGTGLGHVVTITSADADSDGVLERGFVPGADAALARLRSHSRVVEPGQAHVSETLVFADGTWLKRDQYRINDGGHVVGHGAPPWNTNDEIIHGASEFGAGADGRPRTIDIVITPGPAIPKTEDLSTN